MKAIQISNQEGLVTCILPNTILRATNYDIVRKCILDKTKLIRIVDLGGGIFDAVTASTIILIVQKDTLENINNNELLVVLKIEDPELRKFSTNRIKQSRFYSNTSYIFNILVDSAVSKILEKISYSDKELGDLCIDIIEGIVAHKHLITELDVKNSYPLLEGKNIKKYYIAPHTKRILWKPQKIHRTRPAYLWQVDRKILIQRISGGHNPLVAALDIKRNKTFASVNNLILKNEYEGYYGYILGLLNSRLMNFYYASSFSNKSELTVNISKTFLEKLPIRLSDEEYISKIKYSVESILAITKDEDYLQNSIKQAKVRTLEQEIDQLIYKLYGLTEEEIRIVEGADS
jgi:adenine-specific DNA-methyltransferase